ncbi:MAG TPA: helix-turn-helix transcriptional regulator [Thermoanaerobaculia bacterium]|nr:helix-turn-helix transcriptional regulator [Thermoanaerobaculia bacterium]
MDLKPPRSLALAILRKIRDWQQGELALAAGVAEDTVSKWERGRKAPDPETLERLAAVMGQPPSLVRQVLAWIAASQAETAPGGAGGLEEAQRRRIDELAEQSGAAWADLTRSFLTGLAGRKAAEEDRRRAREVWDRLRPASAQRRRMAVEEQPELRSWALCELLCAESVTAAADDARRALELADLALLVAGLVTGAKGWIAQLRAYAWAFVGNARRVAGDLPGADAAFAACHRLWRAGASGEGFPLAAWRILDLEASLRREQRRLPEALALLDRALALCGDHAAAAHVLVNKAKTLEELERYEEAISSLHKAEALVKEGTEPHIVFALRFNLIVNLCHLGLHEDAEPLLPGVRELVARLGNELDRVRLSWLEGRVAAGLGRTEDAIHILLQVRGEFAARGIAYDAALASLELAEIYAAERRTGEVKALARQMAPVFQAQGVHREALAALTFFRRAAEAERVTVELARRLTEYLHRARHDPRLRFEAPR